MTTRHDTALFDECFPCNPLPFLTALFKHVEKHGTGAIKDNKAKRILWIIQSQAYGQLASINLCDEWDRLLKDHESKA